MVEQLTFYFERAIELCILFLEATGVFVLMSAAVKSIYYYLKKDEEVRMRLAKGIALALEFKLGSEVLRTAVVRETGELMILGVIILLRAALTFLIHWEIRN